MMVPNHQASSITERNLSPAPEVTRVSALFHRRPTRLARVDLTWLPVPVERLVVALPQHEEIDHVGHVVIPERGQS